MAGEQAPPPQPKGETGGDPDYLAKLEEGKRRFEGHENEQPALTMIEHPLPK